MISNNSGPVNQFPPTLVRELNETLERAAREAKGPLYAAFDADGTLWDTDAGEAFFDYQIENCDLDGLPADPWQKYLELKRPDPRVGYVWLAQINKGRSLEQVRAWASDCVAKQAPFPVFESQRNLIATLKKLGFEIFVVTASVKWAVEPAAKLVGIDADHVLGITTRVAGGIVTDEPVLPITWREGKAEALLQATGGARPILCSGNTYGDTALLTAATHVRLAVSTQNQPGGLFEEERKLREEAKGAGWMTHQFRAL